MIKKINIIISNYNSSFFPYKATWKINNVLYTSVFETKEEIINYYSGKYINVSFIDKTA